MSMGEDELHFLSLYLYLPLSFSTFELVSRALLGLLIVEETDFASTSYLLLFKVECDVIFRLLILQLQLK